LSTHGGGGGGDGGDELVTSETHVVRDTSGIGLGVFRESGSHLESGLLSFRRQI